MDYIDDELINNAGRVEMRIFIPPRVPCTVSLEVSANLYHEFADTRSY